MPLAERTYSFRAPSDLADRVRAASELLAVVVGESEELQERVARELVRALLRDADRFRAARTNQSAFMRDTIELLVTAAEKVARDLHYADEYAAVERTGDEQASARAMRAAVARRWRDA